MYTHERVEHTSSGVWRALPNPNDKYVYRCICTLVCDRGWRGALHTCVVAGPHTCRILGVNPLRYKYVYMSIAVYGCGCLQRVTAQPSTKWSFAAGMTARASHLPPQDQRLRKAEADMTPEIQTKATTAPWVKPPSSFSGAKRLTKEPGNSSCFSPRAWET